MIIVADSGSTKVDWVAIKEDGSTISVKTAGINPLFITKEEITDILKTSLASLLGTNVSEVYFYGAGVVADSADSDLQKAFKEVFPVVTFFGASDMLAAARALCGQESGIACIIGTGANSCFFDGTKMAEHVNAGGFILGDEASGGYFGRRLLSDFIKGLFPEDIEKAFKEQYDLDYLKIVDKVYKQPAPNRFLAQFSYFIEQHRETPYMQSLLKSGFRDFMTRNVYGYNYHDYAMNVVGSIGYIFRREMEEVANECGVKVGKVLKTPIEGLVEYHKEKYLNKR